MEDVKLILDLRGESKTDDTGCGRNNSHVWRGTARAVEGVQ
jgi:hypothetical protein